LAEDWLSFEIKLIGSKITIILDGKNLIIGLEEPDMKFILQRSGTMMFGVNNVTAQFSDISMSYIPPPNEEDAAAGGSGGAEGGGGGADGLETSEDAEEMEFDEEDEAASALMNGTVGMKACSDKNTCTLRNAWCSAEFKESMPADCLQNFSEYCCGIKAMSQLAECKAEADSNQAEEEPLEDLTVSCFDQDSIEIPKNK